MTWKHPTSPVAKKFKSQPSAAKITLIIFWEMEDEILVHFTPKGETSCSQNYCETEASGQMQEEEEEEEDFHPMKKSLARCKTG
jgi:hypothetical protein